jgi:hypothetical protein
MAQDSNNDGKDHPTVIGRDERLPDFFLLHRGKLTKEKPDKECPNGKKKKYLNY